MDDKPTRGPWQRFQQLAFQAATVCGAMAVVLLGAATQVWDYPIPRTNFGFLCTCFVSMGVLLWFASARMVDADHMLANGENPRNVHRHISGALFFALLVCAWFGYRLVAEDMWGCLRADMPVCTQKAAAIAPEPAATARPAATP